MFSTSTHGSGTRYGPLNDFVRSLDLVSGEGRIHRIEREDDAFRSRVAAAYEELAASFPERIVALDGTRPPGELAQEILEGVRQHS